MANNLKIHGPFVIPCKKQTAGSAKHVTASHGQEFWDNLDAKPLRHKQGCYVFALRAAKGFCPWYVGQATKSFEQECFTHHKLSKYNEVLFDGHKGTPVLFLVAPGGTVNKVPAKTCDEIETYLIHAAYAENPDLKNVKKTKVPTWTIEGVVRPNKGPVAATPNCFRKMLGLHKG